MRKKKERSKVKQTNKAKQHSAYACILYTQHEYIHPRSACTISAVSAPLTMQVILAAELLKHAEELIKYKIHPTSIISGYRLACKSVHHFTLCFPLELTIMVLGVSCVPFFLRSLHAFRVFLTLALHEPLQSHVLHVCMLSLQSHWASDYTHAPL